MLRRWRPASARSPSAPTAAARRGGPAAYCGLYGLKPSLGQIARHGGFPQILSDFEVVGPIAHSVDDLAAAFAILRGYDPSDPRTAAAAAQPAAAGKAHRLHAARRRCAGRSRRSRAPPKTTARAFERLGFVVEEVAAPYTADELAALWTVVAEAGLAWHLASVPDWRRHVGANAVRMADAGAGRSARDYVAALDGIAAMRARSGAFFAQWDFMLSPTTAALAWPADELHPPMIDGKPVGPRGHAVFSAYSNLIGAVAANFPVAVTADAGGIGMQLAAPAGRDDDVLAILKRWEAGGRRDPPSCNGGGGPAKPVEGTATANVHSRLCTASGPSLREPT